MENVQLGRPNDTGQVIVEGAGKLISRNCDFGKEMFILTKDEGTADFYAYKPGEKIRVDTKGGNIIFNDPR